MRDLTFASVAKMLVSKTYRRPTYMLLVVATVLFLLIGRYSYQNSGLCTLGLRPDKPLKEELPLSSQPFPSKIWQSWKDDSDDPTDRTIGFPHQWRVVNPNWRYERITDANIDDYVRDRFFNTTIA